MLVGRGCAGADQPLTHECVGACLVGGVQAVLAAGTLLNVSSSQSNVRCADSAGEPTWQWSPAPSSAVKSRKVLSQVSSSNSCLACPGYHGSSSESITSVGQVIFSAIPASV